MMDESTLPVAALTAGDVIAYADDLGLVIVWNGSATFNVWRDGREVDVFTVYDIDDIPAAVKTAAEWVNETHGTEYAAADDVLVGEFTGRPVTE